MVKFSLEVFLFSILVIIGYTALKIFVLDKIKVNKWLIMGISIVVLMLPSMLGKNINGTIWQYVQTSIVVMLTLWFMDLIGLGAGRSLKKKQEITIKPKAKPNRVKHNKKTNKNKK